MFYFWLVISIIISVYIAMRIDKALYHHWRIKTKAPVFITLTIFIILWWVFALIVDANSN